MKSKLAILIILIGTLSFLVACGSSADSPEAEAEQVEDEHLDEDDHTHSPEDHMAAAHNVPDDAAAVPNPVAFTEDSKENGATLFATNCAVCHGEKGLGDGPSAEALEKKPANLTEAHVQELSDGSLFYIISHGKPETPMPAWEDVLQADDRWHVVNFLRTLVGEHEEGEHMEDEHMEEEHMEGDEHAEDEHMEDEHMEEEHMEGDEHAEDEHSD